MDTNRILDKLDELQKDIHRLDTRIYSLESKLKLVAPMLSLFCVAIFDFIKTKFFGYKG